MPGEVIDFLDEHSRASRQRLRNRWGVEWLFDIADVDDNHPDRFRLESEEPDDA